jgi:ribulose 1,5-bisphosphate carboxylase large subunit-like protein
VECFPDGYRKGTKMIKACTDAGIEGFPMWSINGQVRKLALSVNQFKQENLISNK